MDFGQAIEALKQGKKVARSGWNGKKMFLTLIAPHEYNPDNPNLVAGPKKQPWIGILTADYTFVPWTASQTDILAEDWRELRSIELLNELDKSIDVEEDVKRDSSTFYNNSKWTE